MLEARIGFSKFGGYKGIEGLLRPLNQLISPRDIVIKIQRNITSKSQPNRTKAAAILKIEA